MGMAGDRREAKMSGLTLKAQPSDRQATEEVSIQAECQGRQGRCSARGRGGGRLGEGRVQAGRPGSWLGRCSAEPPSSSWCAGTEGGREGGI